MTGTQLKLFAMAAMLIDHIGAFVIETNILNAPAMALMTDFVPSASWMRWYWVDFVLRSIGRLAFPIFCFLLTEGFRHTHDKKKYLGRLCLFALISEIPYNLAIAHKPVYFPAQNVFFTLALGLAVLGLLEHFEGKRLISFLIILIGFLTATVCRFDYYGFGLLFILAFQKFRDQRRLLVLSLAFVSFCMGPSELFSLLALPLIFRYNGQRGRNLTKNLFYFFYPAHILILFFLSAFVVPVSPL
ncbi:TraX family protein [Holdemania filiformis]|uniref:TraX family protein n=1 Tax=Holdemania filiformis TaxID=61171 RepID=UPI00242D0319|nr:TraX family protein [Holdemania filiformis]